MFHHNCLWNVYGDLVCNNVTSLKRNKIENFSQLPNDNMQSDNETRVLHPGDSFTSFYKNLHINKMEILLSIQQLG